jgi:hypothetical protein
MRGKQGRSVWTRSGLIMAYGEVTKKLQGWHTKDLMFHAVIHKHCTFQISVSPTIS